MASIFIISCSGKRPTNLGITDSRFTACPSSPNCVSSDAHDSNHQIPPYRLIAPADEAWQVTRDLVLKMPRTSIVKQEPGYLHAESSSALMGFVDDFELHLRPAKGIIAIRSASRLGYSDFGVNRNRVETLRSLLISRGVVR